MKNFVHKILQDEDVDNTEDTTNRGTKPDSSYFESYSHPGIHYDMLAVSKSIEKNSLLSENRCKNLALVVRDLLYEFLQAFCLSVG